MSEIIDFKPNREKFLGKISDKATPPKVQKSCVDFCLNYFKNEKGENPYFSTDYADIKEIPFQVFRPNIKTGIMRGEIKVDPEYDYESLPDNLIYSNPETHVDVFDNQFADFRFVALSHVISDGYTAFYDAALNDILTQIYMFDPTRFEGNENLDMNGVTTKIEVGNIISCFTSRAQEPILQSEFVLLCPFSVTLLKQ